MVDRELRVGQKLKPPPASQGYCRRPATSASSRPTPAIRLLVVEPSEVVRRGIRSVFAETGQPPVRIVGEATSASEVLPACRRARPDVVLLELHLPDEGGPTACRELAAVCPRSRVLVFTHQISDRLIQEGVAAGVAGFLLKHTPAATLAQAVRDVAAGRSILDPETTSRALRLLRAGPPGQVTGGTSLLSRQERRVLTCVAEGRTNKQAGVRLGLSENTVKNYLVNAFEKLRVKRRSQAAAVFIQAAATPHP